jgi:hypothetical protein
MKNLKLLVTEFKQFLEFKWVLGMVLVLNTLIVKAQKQYPLYDLEFKEQIKIKKYSPNDKIYNFFELSNKVVYYSSDSNCLVISDLKTESVRRVNFMPESIQYQRQLKPYMGNFGRLDDSTIVLSYEGMWPYTNDKLMLVNINSGIVSYPFKIGKEHKGFVSSLDSNFKDFNKAYSKVKTWFAVSSYPLPVRSSDTTVFVPVYTGDSRMKTNASNLRSNLNSVYVFSTLTNKNKIDSLSMIFSRLNPVFKDSINNKEEVERTLYCKTFLLNEHTFGLYYRGARDVYEYDFIKMKQHIQRVELPRVPVSTWNVSHDSKVLDELMDFNEVYSFNNSSFFMSKLVHPNLDPLSSYPTVTRYLLYDRDYKMKGLLNIHLFEISPLAIRNEMVISINKEQSNSSDEWIYVDCYNLKETQQKLSEDSFYYHKPKKQSEGHSFDAFVKQLKFYQKGMDSIPMLLGEKYCPKCLMKIGSFLRSVQDGDYPHKPLVLYARDSVELLKFREQFGLMSDSSTHYDMDGKLSLKHHFYGYGMAVLQDNGIYKFVKKSHEDLDEILKGICVNGEMIKKFCVPMD